MSTIDQAKAALGDEFSAMFDLVAAQVRRLELRPGARALDIGTGVGTAAVTLALCELQVITGEPADDHSEYAKQAWRENAQKAGVEERITYKPFDAARMPFPDHSFEAVFMLGALHHIGDPEAAVAESARVVAPGGAICIMEPNETMMVQVREKHPTHPEPTDPTPFVRGGLTLEKVREERFDVYLMRTE